MAADTLTTVYMALIAFAVVYQFGLLYGGMWYTRKTTVQCPRCGVYISKYRIETHECHPSLVGYGDDEGDRGGKLGRVYRS